MRRYLTIAAWATLVVTWVRCLALAVADANVVQR